MSDYTMKRLLELARRINERTFSHVNGRDLLAELHPRSEIDILVRRDGRDLRFEGDWLSDLYDAVKDLRCFLATCGADALVRRSRPLADSLASLGMHGQPDAQGIETRRAETGGLGAKPESPVAEGDAP